MNQTATLYALKIKLTSPWLGNQSTRERVRRFRKDASGLIVVDLSQWSWTFKQAIEALHISHVDPDTIRPQTNIDPPTLVLYNRNFNDGKKNKSEMFEAMRENLVLNVNILVTTPPLSAKDGKTPPTIEELLQIFKFSGSFLGLSPWGNSYGYGRFEVEQIKKL